MTTRELKLLAAAAGWSFPQHHEFQGRSLLKGSRTPAQRKLRRRRKITNASKRRNRQ